MFFFGNRNREADFLFGAEWREMARRGMIQLYTAFSRDQVEFIKEGKRALVAVGRGERKREE